MKYIVDGDVYNLSYLELKEKYLEICELDTKDFLIRLPEILHLTCIISFLKEVPSYNTLSDKGLIHELVHLIHIPNEPLVNVEKIKQQFIKEMRLV